MTMHLTKIVQKWFKSQQVGGLVLPDGWWGRPYDGQHSLTAIEESEDTLTIVLDRVLTLRFEGLKSIKTQTSELTFGPFQRLIFDWESFGDDGNRGTREYETGEVKILSAP